MSTSGPHQARTIASLGDRNAPGTAAGWRHFPFRWPDLKRFAIAYVVLTVIAVAIGAAIVHVLGDGPFGELDLNVAEWFADQRSHSVNHLAQIGAGLADAYTLIPAIFVASVLFVVLFRRWNETAFLLSAILLEKAVFVTTTYIVARDRPPVGQLDGAPPTSSYPSGHVAAAVVFYVACAIVICWHTRHVLIRALVWAIAVVVPIAVALSRMILGMHFLSDVTVGAVLGAVTVVVGGHLAYRTMVALDARNGVDSGRGLDGRTEAQEPAAERNRAEREPRSTEAQPRERVTGPVHAEQHP
jgi:membrane-associated phospholipid phosphatase